MSPLPLISLCGHPRLPEVVRGGTSSLPLALQPFRKFISLPNDYAELIKRASHFKWVMFHYKFCVCEAHFHTESIGASPMIIAFNSGKLFVFSTRLLNVNIL